MQERIQYALILLLFVLAGSLDSTSFRNDAESVQPALTQSSIADSSAAVRNFLFTALCSGEVPAEAPVVSLDHKAVIRQRTDARVAAKAVFDIHTVLQACSRTLHVDAIDYYVFSLERILI